jgi:hypothetical protein
MMGTMTDDLDQTKVVKGHGTKGKQNETKLETLENPNA